VAGVLAVLGAVLLVVSLFPPYGASYDEFRLAGKHHIVVYTVLVAALGAGAGSCLLVRRASPVVSVGVLVGGAAAMPWTLLVVAIDGAVSAAELVGPALWLNLVGHVLVVAGALVAGDTLSRTGDLAVAPGWIRRGSSWLLLLSGVVGAVALAVLSQRTTLNPGDLRSYRFPYLAEAAVAVAVAVCAAATVPRRFGVALLAGWFAGGTALVLRFLLRPEAPYPGLSVLFAASLLSLLAVAVPLARRGG
jgi:hypothetical protein